MQNEGKLRLLSILEILKIHSDKTAPLSTQRIMDYLQEEYDLPAHRTTVTNDIDVLRSFGYDIRKIESTSNKYYIESGLSTDDVWLVNAALATSRHVDKCERDRIVGKLWHEFCSEATMEDVQCNLDTEGRTKGEGSATRDIAMTIDRAISKGRKISFEYFNYGPDKHKVLTNHGERYVISPYVIIYGGVVCYVVGYSESAERVAAFRLNRIGPVLEILEEEAVEPPADFKVDEMKYIKFSGYHAKLTLVDIVCKRSIMDSLIDRFGYDVSVTPIAGDKLLAKVKVPVGKHFYGWVFAQGGDVKIVAPRDVKEAYQELVAASVENN